MKVLSGAGRDDENSVGGKVAWLEKRERRVFLLRSWVESGVVTADPGVIWISSTPRPNERKKASSRVSCRCSWFSMSGGESSSTISVVAMSAPFDPSRRGSRE